MKNTNRFTPDLYTEAQWQWVEAKYFTKGRMAVVEGRLQIRDWTDKDGGKRRSAQVVADNVYFGDSKRTVSDSDTPAAGEISEISEEEEGELPF